MTPIDETFVQGFEAELADVPWTRQRADFVAFIRQAVQCVETGAGVGLARVGAAVIRADGAGFLKRAVRACRHLDGTLSGAEAARRFISLEMLRAGR